MRQPTPQIIQTSDTKLEKGTSYFANLSYFLNKHSQLYNPKQLY